MPATRPEADGPCEVERLRRSLDLEHWAAFDDSLRALERLLGQIASGRHGSRPGASSVPRLS